MSWEKSDGLLDLAAALARANGNGDGLWSLTAEVEEGTGDDAGFVRVWLVDANEEIGSYNYMLDYVHRNAIEPLESAVRSQTGDDSFFFDAYSAYGRFVGCAAVSGGA